MTLDRCGHLFGDELEAVAERLDAPRSRSLRTVCGQPAQAPLPGLTDQGPDLALCGAPGRIRTCDTRFRNAFQHLQRLSVPYLASELQLCGWYLSVVDGTARTSC